MNMIAEQPDPEQTVYDRTRTTTIRLIAQELLSQHCKEQNTKLVRLVDLDPLEARRFIEAAQMATSWTLDEDRRAAALTCMADIICADGGDRGLDDYPRSVQQRYVRLAVSSLNALRENLKDTPPDVHHRDRMCRLYDGLFPKERPTRKAVWG